MFFDSNAGPTIPIGLNVDPTCLSENILFNPSVSGCSSNAPAVPKTLPVDGSITTIADCAVCPLPFLTYFDFAYSSFNIF